MRIDFTPAVWYNIDMEKTVKITVFIFVLILALSAAALVGCKPAETYTLLYTVIETQATAVAYEGYEFVKWSDGVFDTVRTDTYISNFNVQAIYEKIN